MKKIGFIIFILALGCKGRSLSLQKEEKSPLNLSEIQNRRRKNLP
jgi:hypothetical protein